MSQYQISEELGDELAQIANEGGGSYTGTQVAGIFNDPGTLTSDQLVLLEAIAAGVG